MFIARYKWERNIFELQKDFQPFLDLFTLRGTANMKKSIKSTLFRTFYYFPFAQALNNMLIDDRDYEMMDDSIFYVSLVKRCGDLHYFIADGLQIHMGSWS